MTVDLLSLLQTCTEIVVTNILHPTMLSLSQSTRKVTVMLWVSDALSSNVALFPITFNVVCNIQNIHIVK
jgi:uncharacterized membrane protein